MEDYRHTLNLPQTAFPMKANLSNREPERLQNWQDITLYQKIRSIRKGAKTFLLHDGPPYANGDIHLGHALNKILKDIIVKQKTLSGFDAPYVPGWDCHGLPIERQVEKKHGKVGSKLTASAFRQACRDYASKQMQGQMDAFKRLGIFGDWDKSYATMHFGYEANIIRALGAMVSKGHLERGLKPVHWCLDCQSALAEAELEYQDKSSDSIDVRFPVVDKKACLKLFEPELKDFKANVSVPIWTTTPWTLPANQAVAVHKDLHYVCLKCRNNGENEFLILAHALVEPCMEKWGIEHYEVMGQVDGHELERIMLAHPFEDRLVPIILSDHVTVEGGTGCVHTAPGHGAEDYLAGLKYDLPIESPVLGNGCYRENVSYFGGQHINKAIPEIVDRLKKVKHLIFHEKIQHSYPHCWRHKTPVIFRATPQWFISMEKNGLREQALKVIKECRWIPGWGEKRIELMIDGRPDWCISRQRNWGTPLPFFVHKDDHTLHPKTPEIIDKVAKAVEQSGIEAWFELDAKDLIGADAEKYVKLVDTLDVWFDSGVSHWCVLDCYPDLSSPADLYLEGSDQHRGWFQTSLLTSVALHDRAPYRQILTHGYTTDTKGRKMSKSLGNVISPDKVIKTYGADILRLWVSATDYIDDVTVSDEIFKRVSEAYRRIRNTARYLLSNLFDFDPKKDALDLSELLPLDAYAVRAVKKLQNEIKDVYEQYQFHLVYQKLHHFCTIEMGSFYLDITKDRQYTCQKNSHARRSCQTAMFHIIETIVRLAAPILSFTAEEIWSHMPGKRGESVFLETWYEGIDEKALKLDEAFWQEIIDVRDEVNRAIETARNEKVIGSALEAKVTIYGDTKLVETLNEVGDELRFVLITSKADVLSGEPPKHAYKSEAIKGLHVAIEKAPSPKCTRCWHYRDDVGQDKKHPKLCLRCVSNVDGEGELRKFA